MTEYELIAEVTTSADPGARVEVGTGIGGDLVQLTLDRPVGKTGAVLTPNEAKRLGEALTKAATA